MTLETAKALKEAGWDKKTKNIFSNHFILSYSRNRTQITSYGNRGVIKPCGMQLLDDTQSEILQKDAITDAMDFETYPCPSLEELLAVIPCYTKLNNEYYFNLCKSIDNKRYYAEYRDNSQDVMMFKDELLQTTDPDPTEAVAQLWLKLRKEGIV